MLAQKLSEHHLDGIIVSHAKNSGLSGINTFLKLFTPECFSYFKGLNEQVDIYISIQL